MGRAPRASEGGFPYLTVCRGLDGLTIFPDDQALVGFTGILQESLERWEPRLLAYALLPDQWLALVVPRKDGDLSKWIGWVTSVHAMRNRHLASETQQRGIYERRYRSFPVQDNERILDAMLYIESLPVQLGITSDSKAYAYTSLHQRATTVSRLSNWISPPPVPLPSAWESHLQEGLAQEKLELIQRSIERGSPYGDPGWVERIVKRFRLESTLRPRGRPRKASL
ncbi:transposase [Pirellulaceae bacterium SH467]